MKPFIFILFIFSFLINIEINYAFAGTSHTIALQTTIQPKKSHKATLQKGIDKLKKITALYSKPKKKWLTILLLSLLGFWGAHLFYLGYIKKGFIRMAILLSSILIFAIIYISLTFIFLALFGGSFYIGIFLGSVAITLALIATGLMIWLIILTIRDLVRIIHNKLFPADRSNYTIAHLANH